MKRLSLFIAAMLFAVCSFAQLSIWDGTDDVWTKGAGTESSPYLIESAQQLAFIASMVNGGVTTYENTYFKLITNIDLNDLTWTPIGSVNYFKGNFDGNNKTIYGSSSALFDYIKNATLEKININMGGLVGERADSSIIESCFYTGSKEMIRLAINTFVKDCKIQVMNDNRSSSHSTLIDNATNCIIRNCRADGYIKVTYTSSEYTLGNYGAYLIAAGIVQRSMFSRYVQCQSNCIVESINPSYPVVISSGMIGMAYQDTIFSCSNTAKCSGKYHSRKSDGSGYVDSCHVGFIGMIQKNAGSIIKNSFTTNQNTTVIWDWPYTSGPTNGTGGQNTYTSSNKTESAMKSASFPIVLNTDSTVFVKDVTPNVNDGYPIYVDQVYTVTDSLSTIGFTSAQLLGHFYALNADSVGFEYKESTDNTHWYKSVTAQVAGNVITYDLSDLTTGTNYVYRLWVERDGVRYFGDVLSFKTLECSQTITPISASICQGEEYFFNEQHLTTSGAYRDTLIASNGCDSIVELTLTVMPTANIEKYDTIMVGDSYDFYGDILTESGTYEHYVPMANKCNLIVMHLYVRQPSVVVTATSSDATMGSVTGGGTYEKYSQVTLTAIPNIGCKFVKWTDDSTENPRIITPTEDCSYTAVFEQIQYTLTVSSTDTQKGNVSGGGKFTYGQQASITATPNEGYSFKTWSDGDINASRTITIVSDSNLIASFEEIKCTLTLATNNATMGTVSGAGVYTYGTEVTISATPNTGYQFVNWSDNDVNASRTFIITKDMSLTANFEALKYMVTVTSNDETLGTVYGGGEYAYNAQASLMAIPNENCEFITWNNGVNTNPYVFSVTENVTIQAIFRHTGEGIEDVDANSTSQKMIQDGHIFILRGDKTYTITGQIVK